MRDPSLHEMRQLHTQIYILVQPTLIQGFCYMNTLYPIHCCPIVWSSKRSTPARPIYHTAPHLTTTITQSHPHPHSHPHPRTLTPCTTHLNLVQSSRICFWMSVIWASRRAKAPLVVLQGTGSSCTTKYASSRPGQQRPQPPKH